jgi:DNA-directed RNA polymerase specialized sigma24 family protein
MPLDQLSLSPNRRQPLDLAGQPAQTPDPADCLAIDEGNEEGWPLPPTFGLASILNEVIMSCLSEKERAVIHDRFVDEKDLVELCKEMGFSRQRGHFLYDRAIYKLRRALADYSDIKSYLEHE